MAATFRPGRNTFGHARWQHQSPLLPERIPGILPDMIKNDRVEKTNDR